MVDKEPDANSGCYTRWTAGYTRTILRIQTWLSEMIGSLGAVVSRRPVLFVVLSILAAAAAGAGWARFQVETATDKLWVPQDSQAMKDEDWVSATYGTGGGGAQVLASVPPGRQGQYGENALQLAIFWELFQVDTAVRGIVVTDGGSNYGWQDVCEQDFDGRCKYGGPLNFWSMNFTTYLQAVNGSATNATAGNRAVLIQTVNKPRFPDNTSVSTLTIFGGIVLSPLPNPPTGAPPLYLSSAEVISQGYGLRTGLSDSVEDKWYDQFLDIMKDWASTAQYTSFAYIAGNSVENEIGRSVTADLYLIIISVAIFILVAIMGLSRWHLVATRSSLALLGVVSAVLAMVAGYGLSLLFGCPFNTLSQTLPYVLLGLGVDCVFILVKGYDGIAAEDLSQPLETRFYNLMSRAGTSVVVTLLASAVAFALGAISELPAVQWFSVYATMGVVCICIATLTFFTGVFVLTERRITRNRLDCCCCVTSGGPPVPTAARSYYVAGRGKPAGAPEEPELAAPTAVVIYPAAPVPAMAAGAAGTWAPPTQMVAPSKGPVAESVEGPDPQQQQQQQQGPNGLQGTLAAPGQTSPERSVSQGSSMAQRQASNNDPMKKAAVPGVVVSGDKLAPAPGTPLASPSPKSAPAGGPVAHEEEPNIVKKIFARYYAPFLTKWYVKVLVVLVFIGWAVLSGVGIPKLKEGQPLSELAPDDSYLQDYVTIMTDTFQQQIGSPTNMYFRWFSPASPEQQAKMLKALGMTLENSYINSTVSAFQGNWLIDFISWVQTTQPNVTLVQLDGCSNPYIGRVSGDLGMFVQPAVINGCVPGDVFFPLLQQFLSTSRSFLEDVRFDYSIGTNGTQVPYQVWSSRFPVVHTAKGDDGSYGRQCLKSVRHLEDQVNDDLYAAQNVNAPGEVFIMFTDDYIYDEGDAILGTMTLEYVLLAVAGVGVVLMLTLPSFRAVLMMMVAVGLVDFFLFGEMFILNIRFNQVSIINMVMATGLSVDYSVYFAQRFVMVTADGTLNGRMTMAMADTGSAVFIGGMTALAGTIPLAFSTSTILRTFFALVFGTIAFALLVGLMLMPVIFSIVGPPPLNLPDGVTGSGAHGVTHGVLPEGVSKGDGLSGPAAAGQQRAASSGVAPKGADGV